MATPHSIESRFFAKVQKTDTCWLWTGSKQKSGYGWFMANWRSGPELAHRVSFRLTNGRDPGPELCHTCDVRACVRPDHLYEGTRSTNMRDAADRGRHHNSRKTHCKNGHEFTPDNTIVYRSKSKYGAMRQCRACSLRHKAQWNQKQRDLKAATRALGGH